MVSACPDLAFWRASTDNDRGCGFPQHASAWMVADVFLRKEGCTVLEKSEQRVQICYKYSVPLVPGAGVEITYTVEPQAALRVMPLTCGWLARWSRLLR